MAAIERTPEGFIWIGDAATKYQRSREWLFSVIRAKELTGYRFPGDRRLYLKAEEVERFINTPRPTHEP